MKLISIYKIPAMLIVGNVITSSFLQFDLCHLIISTWVTIPCWDAVRNMATTSGIGWFIFEQRP